MQSQRALIVASRTDQASLNIAQNIIQQAGFIKQETLSPWEGYTSKNLQAGLVIIGKELIHVKPPDLPEDSGPTVFVSKHRSSTDTPALTVHATGNLTGEALYGGRPEEVSLVEPFRVQAALSSMSGEVKRLGLRIEVTMEATHHGPTNLPVPVCFIEIGSGPEQWGDAVLGGVAAKAAIAAVQASHGRTPPAVGFGGTHYPARHTKLNLQGAYEIGHVVSRYAFDRQVSDRVLQNTFQRTAGECRTGLVDWKGLKGEQRRSLLDKLSAWSIEAIRV